MLLNKNKLLLVVEEPARHRGVCEYKEYFCCTSGSHPLQLLDLQFCRERAARREEHCCCPGETELTTFGARM